MRNATLPGWRLTQTPCNQTAAKFG